MADVKEAWLTKVTCDHCHKEVKDTEIVELEKDFDSAKFCTHCAGKFVKKLENFRANFYIERRKKEIEIFKDFMWKKAWYQDDSGTLGCLVFLVFAIIIIVGIYLLR